MKNMILILILISASLNSFAEKGPAEPVDPKIARIEKCYAIHSPPMNEAVAQAKAEDRRASNFIILINSSSAFLACQREQEGHKLLLRDYDEIWATVQLAIGAGLKEDIRTFADIFDRNIE